MGGYLSSKRNGFNYLHYLPVSMIDRKSKYIIISIYIEMNSSQKGQSNCYQSQCSSLDQIQVFRVAGVHSSIMIASQWWISFDQRITFYAGYTGHSWTVINTPIACCWLTHLIWGSGIITWIECTIHANLFSVTKFFFWNDDEITTISSFLLYECISR